MTATEQPAPTSSTSDGTSLSLSGTDPTSPYVQVFDRIAMILDALADSQVDLDLSQVATLAGLNRLTTNRLLATLLRHGYVEAGEVPGTFRLGLRLFQLGAAVHRRIELRQCAMPFMHDLAEATEETVSLSIVHGDEALCVERVEGKHVHMLSMQVGSTLPLYAGAASRVLLACLPPERIDAILAGRLRPLTRFTEIQPARLREIIAQTQVQGFAISDEDVTLGVAAIAVPIRGIEDSVLGAISISGFRQRLTRDRMPILVAQVSAAANRVSRSMGYPG